MRRNKNDKKDPYPENGFEEWGGYMNAKKAKLTEQFNEGASKESRLQITSNIFSGISVYVNGYTVPSSEEIKMAMMLHGGQFHQYYSASKTKYIIASNLADAKLKKIKGQPRVVKPQWIADCLSSKKLLDFRPYLLYSNQTKSQPKIQFPQLSEFESPVPSRFKKLQISFGEDHKMTSTPKVNKTKEAEIDSESSLDLSGDIFDQLDQPAANLLESSDSRDSDIVQFAGTQLSVEEDEDPFDSTLVAEELDAVEKEAEMSKKEINFNSTSEEVKALLADSLQACVNPDQSDPSKDNEVTALVDVEEKKPESGGKEGGQKGAMKRAGEANFLAEFYGNSRLHHISTMASTFKVYVAELRKSHCGVFTGRERLQLWKKEQGIQSSWAGGEKVFMHVDMDCFFVSVGLRSRPELRGLPVAVTHAKGNPPPGNQPPSTREAEFRLYKQRIQAKAGTSSNDGDSGLEERLSWKGSERSSMAEIASCNYEARQAGVKNGMFLGQALKLCPNLKTISYNFEAYKEVSYALYNIVASFTLDVEAVSCDEMFVDCTELLAETNTEPLHFASFVRSKIKEATKCPASTGFGANLLQARMATKKAKPDGQYHLVPDQVASFMKDVKVADLPGVGRNIAFKMRSAGVERCEELQKWALPRLQASFGPKLGTALYKHCRGQDERALESEHVRKSVSAEVNYGVRLQSLDECQAFVRELAEEVQRRLEAIDKQGSCITLKLMVKAKEAPLQSAKFMGHGVCDSCSKSLTLTAQTSDAQVIAREAMYMMRQMAVDFTLLRGVGIQVSKLVDKKKSQEKGRLDQFLVVKGAAPQKAPPAPALAAPLPEIDEMVLAELPEDIRQEILREYKITPNLEAAGPSTSRAHTSYSCKSTAELSLSQIDPTFLEALPQDLKMEVVAQLKSTRPRRCGETNAAAALRSPKKADSPIKKKRGRPKGSRNGSFKELPKLKVPISPVKVANEPVEQERKEETVEVEEEGILSANAKLEELVVVVKEWVQSAQQPSQMDVEMMLDFFKKLLKVKKIDTVHALLRTIKLNVLRNSSNAWMAAYEQQLLPGVQPLIVQLFGCKLKV